MDVPRLRDDSGPQTRTPVTPIDGLVFTTSKGHPLHETNVVKYLARDLAEAGLPRVTNHDLRHTAASLLWEMGVPTPAIADILGHSTTRLVEDLYRHRSQKVQEEAAAKMQEALG